MTLFTLKTINPLLWRVIVFLGLFVIISGIVGPKVISGGILFRDGFALYGSIGKALIFGLIAFLLLVRHNKLTFMLLPWRIHSLVWFIASFLTFAFTWIGIENLLAGQRTTPNLLLAHGGLLLGLIFAAIGCIGRTNILSLWRIYKREISYAVLLTIAFYVFLFVVYALWEPLASFVLVNVTWLLELTGLHVTVVQPHTLLFDKFGVTISEYCSGVESIALFTSLYAVVGLLEWKHLNRRRYFIVFPFALLMLCLLNMLRVYGLIVAGYFINPDIAFSLFHTYAGLLFFIIYSAAFWAIAYKHLIRKSMAKRESP